MSRETMFYELCLIMATLEDGISAVESIGLIVEPDKGLGLSLYDSCSRAYRIAATLLNFPDVETENNVCNELLSATKENVTEISKKVWNKYGIK